MWPFTKKAKKTEDQIVPSEHKWSVKTGDIDIGSVIVRVNETAIGFAKNSEMNIKVGFAIPFRVEGSNGLPDPIENESLNEIEDAICDLMRQTGPAIQVLVITAEKFKEYVFYIKNGEGIASAHQSVMKMFPEHDIQCYGKYDSEWDTYFEWQKA